MTVDYTINDAWEDGYQAGYERGVLMALDHACSIVYPVHLELGQLAEKLSNHYYGIATKDEWLDIFKNAGFK